MAQASAPASKSHKRSRKLVRAPEELVAALELAKQSVPGPVVEADTLTLEAQAMERISRSLHKKERDLYNVKWWDYRLSEPADMTARFTAAYRAAYQEVMKVRVDHIYGPYQTGLARKPLFELKPAQSTSLWKARQAADAIGCPYDFYCLTALWVAEKANWTYLSSPSQLYDSDMANHIACEWRDEKLRTLRFAQDKFYARENYRGHPYQISYQHYLCEQISSRKNPELSLYTALIMQRALIPHIAVERLGPRVVQQALNLARKLSHR